MKTQTIPIVGSVALGLLLACSPVSQTESTRTFGAGGKVDEVTDAAQLDSGDSDPNAVPAESTALFDYLQARTYEALPGESAVHSSGAHGQVRSYINEALFQSLEAENELHPAGSASVKELHKDGELVGWSVYVKVGEEKEGADNWYWYEVRSLEENDPIVDEVGAPRCAGCHSRGVDYVTIEFPLR